MRSAIIQVAVADISMSLDNVLAVAGAARDHPYIMIFGLLLSIALMAVAAQLIARLIDRHRWIAYVGLGIVLFVAGQDDLGGRTRGVPRTWTGWSESAGPQLRPRRGCPLPARRSPTKGANRSKFCLEPRRPGRAPHRRRRGRRPRSSAGRAALARRRRRHWASRRPNTGCTAIGTPVQAARRGPRSAARAWRLIGMRRPTP